MKKVTYLFFLLPIVLWCCKKKKDPVIIPDPDFNFVYDLRYDSVITMQANSSTLFIFYVDVVNGNISNNNLYCTINSLPGNMTVSPATLRVAQLKGGVFTLSAGDIPTGTDTLRFSVYSHSTGTQNRKLLLNIVPPIDYAPKFVGTYDSCYDFCAPKIFKYQSVVKTNPDSAYTIYISNINVMGANVWIRAKISDIVVVPFQDLGSGKIWGRGTYNKDPFSGHALYEMSINDTIAFGTDTTYCTAHIEH